MGEVVYGPGHVKSLLGILKICEIFFCLLAVILVAVHGWSNGLIKTFYAGTVTGIIISLIIFALSMTELGRSLNKILKQQCYVHLVLFLYISIVAAVMLAKGYSKSHRAGGVFGLAASVVYLIDGYLSYQSYENRVFCF